MIPMSIDSAVIQECTQGSFNGSMTFEEVVRRLGAAGVERYEADLVRMEKTYYGRSGETERETLPLQDPPAVAERFSEEGVKQALRAVQQREIGYPEFLRRILAAGATGYSVFLEGRRAIYFGRLGDVYVERFPGSQ